MALLGGCLVSLRFRYGIITSHLVNFLPSFHVTLIQLPKLGCDELSVLGRLRWGNIVVSPSLRIRIRRGKRENEVFVRNRGSGKQSCLPPEGRNRSSNFFPVKLWSLSRSSNERVGILNVCQSVSHTYIHTGTGINLRDSHTIYKHTTYRIPILNCQSPPHYYGHGISTWDCGEQ